MRRSHDDVVVLASVLRPENSVALDSVMRLTKQNETDAVNQAIKLYAAIASVAADPRNPTIGIIADRLTTDRPSSWQRAWRRALGKTTLVQWLEVELCDEVMPDGDGG